MRTGLIMLATAATIGTAAIGAAPASAQYHHDGYGYGDRGGRHHDRWDHRRDWHRDHGRQDRWHDGRGWRHHHRDYGYNGYYGRGYYGY